MCIHTMLSSFSFLCLHVYVFRANLGIKIIPKLWDLVSVGADLCKHPMLPVSAVIDLLQLFA